MVFQRMMKPRRRRPWLCGGSDTDEVAVDSRAKSTITKTLSKQAMKGRISAVDHRTGSSSTGGDESSRSENDSRDQIILDTFIPAWKAENFLSNGPLVEDDWWEDDNIDDGDIDDDDDDESSCDESRNGYGGKGSNIADNDNHHGDLQQQSSYDHSPSWDNDIDLNYDKNDSYISTTNNNNSEGKKFCNRGLQTWYQARETWLSASSPLDERNDHQHHRKKKDTPPIPESFRKELVQCLIDRRQFELSHSIPLVCVVDAYQQVWRENGCD